MGGIKNKLSKLSNKVKTLLSPLSLKGAVSRRLTEGSPKLGSRLPSFSQPSEMLTRNISDTRKSARWSLYASKTIGSLRPIALAKYTGLVCLSLAILFTLVLNIVSSYSSSNIESSAEPVSEVSTLANDSSSTCDPSNTNAASCISLSITSSSSSTSTGGDDANLSLLIPQGGGIATGRHTVEVSSNNVAGYYVMLTGNAGSPAMTPSATTSQAFIQSTTGTLANPTYLDKGQWGSWGIALPNSSLYTGFNTNEMDYSSTDQDVLHKTTWAAVPGKESDDSDKTIIKTTASSKKTDSYPIYYGVRVDSPVSVPADTYAAQVVYTATTNEVPMPTITSTSSNTYELGSGADSTVAITGTNLASTYKVYIESNADSTKQYDITNTITNLTDTGLTVTIPTDQTNPDLESGDYTIHVVTQGGETTTLFAYTESKIKSSYVDYGEGIGHVQVDYDANMIPITYTGNETNPQWVIADPANNNSNTDLNWYDYPSKKWANAVTLTEEGLSLYKGKPVGTEIDEQYVLGYWVYIPRYAYQVQRKEVRDHYVSDSLASNNGGFNIKFEAADDFKKEPVETCSTEDSNMFYTDMDGMESEPNYIGFCHTRTDYPTSQDDYNKTTWATHPAFTWGTEELNGFWIGKFETTGSTSQPTVLPNQKHMSQYSGNIGDMYDVAKSMGVSDQNNKYGNTTSTNQSNQNNNKLAISTSHMLKNSEWGAVAYLASSKYGAGVNKVQINGNYASGSDDNGDSSRGVTGCGPQANNDENDYSTVGTMGTSTACGSADKAYNGTLGQYASTTNNVYGVYDMSGGAWEYVMGSYTTNSSQSSTTNFSNATKPPYVDLYPNTVFTNNNYLTNNNQCTWATCGGHALYETKNVQSVSGYYRSWGGDFSDFVGSSDLWFNRGGCANNGSSAGVFASSSNDGGTFNYYGFRVALLVNT